ncbi:MAG: hypothetical protein IJQ59_01385 [Bacteroidaceae bacterium]|nr:hypothetical protein [Bacteroidaceae bacterium]
MFISPAHAQTIEDGEAFYIYRNDGDFNGFFYDQVQEMRYSKIDLEGVEHEEYVIQEVLTSDSLYRIPLAAIDSIGFQQPEFKFNPKLRHMDQLGMTEYISAVNGLTLTFQSSLPTHLRPQVDDVLVGFTGLLSENFFGGRVTNVSTTGNGIVVTCEALTKMSQLFERFVSVEQVGTDENTHQVRHRMAGYHSMRRAISDGLSMTLFNYSGNLNISLLPEQAHVFVKLSLSLGVKIGMVMVYNINGDSFFIKSKLAEDFSLAPSVSVGIKGGGEKSLAVIDGVKGIAFPAVCPIFEVRPFPELVVKWDGELKANIALPGLSKSMRQTFTIDSDRTPLMTYEGNEMESPSQSGSPSLGGLDVGLQFNGSLQVGVKSQVGIYTNSIASVFFDAGMGVDIVIGPKLRGSVEINAESFDSGDGLYSMRNTHIGFVPISLDYEAYGKAEFLDWTGDDALKYVWADGNFELLPVIDYYMFPTIEGRTNIYNADNKQIEASMGTDKRMVFWPSSLGLALMDKKLENIVTHQYLGSMSFGSFGPDQMSAIFPMSGYKPGVYNVVPILGTDGRDLPIKSMKATLQVPPYLDVDSVVQVPAKGGTFTISANTNGTLGVSNEFLKAEKIGNSTVSITVPENKDFKKHDYILTLGATAEDPEAGMTMKDVRIEQAPSDLPQYISLGPGFFAVYAPGTGEYSNYQTRVPCKFTLTEDGYTVSGSYSSNHMAQGPYPETTDLLIGLTFSSEDGAPSVPETIQWSFNITVSKDGITGSGQSYSSCSYTIDGEEIKKVHRESFTIDEGWTRGYEGGGITSSHNYYEYYKWGDYEYTDESSSEIDFYFYLFKTLDEVRE